jgi:uncharacterized protein (DUF1501 family)
MKRREFISQLPFLSAIPFSLGGVPFQILSNSKHPVFREKKYGDAKTVLIILQMHGGNDGLNTVIPVSNYDQYYNARPNLAIPDKFGPRAFIKLDSTLPEKAQVGLHPDMTGLKELYDMGKMCLIEGVSYPNSNGSHFRGRDIQFMGGGADDYYNSGWIGRYIQAELEEENYEYPDDFVNDPTNFRYKDPLALEFGNEVSLVFHQDERIPASISIDDPESFFDLVSNDPTNLPGYEEEELRLQRERGLPPDTLQGSNYYKELTWILGLEERSNPYADRLIEAYNKGGKSSVNYPRTYPLVAPAGSRNNPIAGQMEIIARLIGGGLETRVFLVRVGGFDTHANQVEKYDSTLGGHAALLYHISATIKAFQEDLKRRNVEHRVLTTTTTEFGRRIYSNFSFGSDHGEAAPMFLFGNLVKPGVLGDNMLENVTPWGNIAMQYDYRKIYASILEKWMGMKKEVIDTKVFPSDFMDKDDEALPIISEGAITEIINFKNERFYLKNCFPNPASEFTNITFRINNSAKVRLRLIDRNGHLVKELLNEVKDQGEHSIRVDVSTLQSGVYIYQLDAGNLRAAKKLIVVR